TAIVQAREANRLAIPEVRDFLYVAAKGVSGAVERKSLTSGNAAVTKDAGTATESLSQLAEYLRTEGQTSSFSAADRKPAGVVGIADAIKPSAPDATRRLKAEGLCVVMLTGDNRATALVVAKKLGIEELEAEVPPDNKAEAVSRLQKTGRIVAMAGD